MCFSAVTMDHTYRPPPLNSPSELFGVAVLQHYKFTPSHTGRIVGEWSPRGIIHHIGVVAYETNPMHHSISSVFQFVYRCENELEITESEASKYRTIITLLRKNTTLGSILSNFLVIQFATGTNAPIVKFEQTGEHQWTYVLKPGDDMLDIVLHIHEIHPARTRSENDILIVQSDTERRVWFGSKKIKQQWLADEWNNLVSSREGAAILSHPTPVPSPKPTESQPTTSTSWWTVYATALLFGVGAFWMWKS